MSVWYPPAMSTTSHPYLSVIVELDNVLHGELGRARTMLTRLLDQIRESKLEPRVEVLVMYDETAIRPKDAEDIVTTTARETPFVQLVATKGLRYYSLKNEARGGRRARSFSSWTVIACPKRTGSDGSSSRSRIPRSTS